MNLMPSTKNTKFISCSEFESYPSRLATATCSYFRAFGSHTKRNVLFIAEPQDDFFCFIPPSLGAKCEF